MAGETIKELLASGAVVPDRPGSKRLVPAAPAPSSLAGGERYGDETAEQIVRRWADWINDVSSDMDEPEWSGKTHNDVLNERDFIVRRLAALSPEAPPVSERERELERALEGLLNTSGARPSKGYNSMKYSEAVTRAENLLLTPRHEAPAEGGVAKP